LRDAGDSTPAADLRVLAKRSLLLLGGLSLLMYWPVLLGRVPFPARDVTQFPPWISQAAAGPPMPPHAEMGDLITELYPWKAYTRRAVASGTLPLWNPHLLLGAPFLGDLQTGLFYPLNLIYYVLPTPLAWSLSILIRTVLAGLLATLLARALRATPTAALTGGVIFGFCAWVTAFQTRPHLDTSLWLPLVFLSIDRLQRRPGAPSVALTAAAFALPVLAGQPENALHLVLAGLLFFAYRLAWRPAESATRARLTLLFAAAGSLALALAAVQTLPALEFIGQVDRSLSVPWGPKPLYELGAFLSRDLYSNPSSARIPIPESAAYAGMLTLLVAPLAWFHPNRRDVIFFLALLLATLGVVYGIEPFYWLSVHTPLLKGIPNGRLLVIADLCLAVLAALGLSALSTELAKDQPPPGKRAPRKRKGSKRAPPPPPRVARPSPKWWLPPAIVLAVCIGGVLFVLSHAKPDLRAGGPGVWTEWRSPVSSAVFLAAASGLLALGLTRRISSKTFPKWVLAFCAVDLVTAGYAFLPFASAREIYPPAPTFDFLRKDPEPKRVAPVGVTWGASFELVYGLDSATGYTVVLRQFSRLMAPLGVSGGITSLSAEKIVQSPGRLLDLANVKYLAATSWNTSAQTMASRPDRFRRVFEDGPVQVFENLSVLPRAFLVPASGARVFEGEAAELAAVQAPEFDPVRTVILPTPPPPPGAAERGIPAAAGVTGYAQRINDVSLHARAVVPSILVVSQMHYPGWKAIVDGAEAPLLRADYAFVGVALAPGAHDVRLVYRPASFRIGLLLSSAGLLIALVLWRRSPRIPTAERMGGA